MRSVVNVALTLGALYGFAMLMGRAGLTMLLALEFAALPRLALAVVSTPTSTDAAETFLRVTAEPTPPAVTTCAVAIAEAAPWVSALITFIATALLAVGVIARMRTTAHFPRSVVEHAHKSQATGGA